MNKYTGGKIYCIRSHQTADIYIGSTYEPLKVRLHGHVRHYRSWKKGKYHYVTSYRLLKYTDYYIELLETFPCNSKEELCRREGQLIRENPCVNKCIAGRTVKEYYQDNKDEILEKKKQYQQDNKESIVVYKKQYYQENKDEILVKRKKHYQENKDKILVKRNVKHDCECGGKYTNSSRAKHFKTKKHLNSAYGHTLSC